MRDAGPGGGLKRRLDFWHRLLEAHPRFNLVSGTFGRNWEDDEGQHHGGEL
jgi:hypothetical protein